MRRLAYVYSADEQARITELLEGNGIPIYCQAGTRAVPFIGGRSYSTIFVCINSQYDDAVALLANENHEVRNPVDVEAFKTAAETTSPALVKAVLLVLAAVVAAWVLVSALVPHR
ncbi:MAG TPA: hypothetical protein VJX31_06360 [Casimicrobiaceae bacterium]|nr:hypothetical protein [Casimicrobiaceae bacterium]